MAYRLICGVACRVGSIAWSIAKAGSVSRRWGRFWSLENPWGKFRSPCRRHCAPSSGMFLPMYLCLGCERSGSTWLAMS